MLFNYRGILQVDADTYEAWLGHLEDVENSAIRTAKILNSKTELSADNSTLKAYCQKYVFISEFGDNLSATLFKYHTEELNHLEEALHYGW